MTTIVKGFASIPALALNTPGQTANAGELSNKTRSYSKDIKIYNNINTADEVSLFAFSIKDGTNDSNIPNAMGQQANQLLNYIFTNMKARGGSQVTLQVLIDQLTGEFGTIYNGIELGNWVSVSGFYLPNYVRFVTMDGSNVEFRVWFSNASFETGYDTFTLTVIPPVLSTALGNLKTTSRAQVEAALAAFKSSDLAARIKSATDEAPFSELHIEPIEWVNSSNTNERLTIEWNIIVYGNGYTIDNIKDKIKELLTTVSNNVEEWRPIFPSLFGGSVFKLTPYWDKHSIQNNSLDSSYYSPITGPNDIINYAMRTEPVGSLAHVSANAEGLPVPYKGLVLSAVGNVDNANGYTKITQMYPDYIPVPSTSIEVNRMSARTQSFVRVLTNLAIAAEVLSSNSQLPNGVSRTNVGGILYATSTLDGVVYMMVGRSSLPVGN